MSFKNTGAVMLKWHYDGFCKIEKSIQSQIYKLKDYILIHLRNGEKE